MHENDIEKLFNLASTFRTAILECDPKSLYITLQDFPNGACGDAALLLAKYFVITTKFQFFNW